MNFKIFSLFMFLASVICAVSAGVDIESISPGDGSNFPTKGQKVKVHYTGSLDDGTVFDSTRSRGKPFQFVIGYDDVLKCWSEGIPQLSIGERAKLYCSPDYAYGTRGHPGIVPPNSRITYDVELLSIENRDRTVTD